MTRLVLIRHAKAEVDGPTDFERNLSSVGQAQSRQLGSCADQWLVPSAEVLLSPSARTMQTWQEIADQLSVSHPELTAIEVKPDDRIYEASAGDLLEILNESTAQQLVMVGHNPGIARLALLLADGLSSESESFLRNFRPSSVAVFEAPLAFADWGPGLATLKRFLSGHAD